MSALDPISLLKPRRRIRGMSAILLPFDGTGRVDWDGFRAHCERTVNAGLAPAVDMDTGFVHLIDDDIFIKVLEITQQVTAGTEFVAGAFVSDNPGAALNVDGYRRRIELIEKHGGTAVIFQSFGLIGLPEEEIADAYRQIGRDTGRFMAFELGNMIAPFGRIYSLDTYAEMLAIPNLVGAKHSSFQREPEWQRLLLRNRLRPDFQVFTGNDLAIDMVMYGSDYLLGLSTMAPDLFALRDRYWLEGDARFYQLNDVLQYLGYFSFREPVPGYKHNAAQFLKLRGWLKSDETHPQSPKRPDADVAVLAEIWDKLRPYCG